jgi:hypothetical protein
MIEISDLISKVNEAYIPSIIFMTLALSVLMIPKSKIVSEVKIKIFTGFFILAVLSIVGAFTLKVLEIEKLPIDKQIAKEYTITQ